MGDCTLQPDFQTCSDCFIAQDPAGYEAFASQLVSACGCVPGATCLADCDTNVPATDICGPPIDITIPNQACVDCVNAATAASDACVFDFQIACSSDVPCTNFLDEVALCPP